MERIQGRKWPRHALERRYELIPRNVEIKTQNCNPQLPQTQPPSLSPRRRHGDGDAAGGVRDNSLVIDRLMLVRSQYQSSTQSPLEVETRGSKIQEHPEYRFEMDHSDCENNHAIEEVQRRNTPHHIKSNYRSRAPRKSPDSDGDLLHAIFLGRNQPNNYDQNHERQVVTKRSAATCGKNCELGNAKKVVPTIDYNGLALSSDALRSLEEPIHANYIMPRGETPDDFKPEPFSQSGIGKREHDTRRPRFVVTGVDSDCSYCQGQAKSLNSPLFDDDEDDRNEGDDYIDEMTESQRTTEFVITDYSLWDEASTRAIASIAKERSELIPTRSVKERIRRIESLVSISKLTDSDRDSASTTKSGVTTPQAVKGKLPQRLPPTYQGIDHLLNIVQTSSSQSDHDESSDLFVPPVEITVKQYFKMPDGSTVSKLHDARAQLSISVVDAGSSDSRRRVDDLPAVPSSPSAISVARQQCSPVATDTKAIDQQQGTSEPLCATSPSAVTRARRATTMSPTRQRIFTSWLKRHGKSIRRRRRVLQGRDFNNKEASEFPVKRATATRKTEVDGQCTISSTRKGVESTGDTNESSKELIVAKERDSTSQEPHFNGMTSTPVRDKRYVDERQCNNHLNETTTVRINNTDAVHAATISSTGKGVDSAGHTNESSKELIVAKERDSASQELHFNGMTATPVRDKRYVDELQCYNHLNDATVKENNTDVLDAATISSTGKGVDSAGHTNESSKDLIVAKERNSTSQEPHFSGITLTPVRDKRYVDDHLNDASVKENNTDAVHAATRNTNCMEKDNIVESVIAPVTCRVELNDSQQDCGHLEKSTIETIVAPVKNRRRIDEKPLRADNECRSRCLTTEHRRIDLNNPKVENSLDGNDKHGDALSPQSIQTTRAVRSASEYAKTAHGIDSFRETRRANSEAHGKPTTIEIQCKNSLLPHSSAQSRVSSTIAFHGNRYLGDPRLSPPHYVNLTTGRGKHCRDLRYSPHDIASSNKQPVDALYDSDSGIIHTRSSGDSQIQTPKARNVNNQVNSSSRYDPQAATTSQSVAAALAMAAFVSSGAASRAPINWFSWHCGTCDGDVLSSDGSSRNRSYIYCPQSSNYLREDTSMSSLEPSSIDCDLDYKILHDLRDNSRRASST